ncbi:hypothetical protein RHS01_02584 [Rhizoctonia solani]|uniref:CTLH domain-containing protein n=1 Tax=Rhizoctonia solani TaxID=456999 RepID=A0A8H7IIB5_9AGAM|nr:hypothetical protein RHS01_02584 [Rhizoctonia solani]
MSLTQANGGLLSVSDKELFYPICSITATKIRADICESDSHREDAESIDRCPLWLPKSSSGDASGDSNLQPSTHEATPALDHASLPERDNDDQVSNNTKAPHPKENITTDIKISPVSDNVLVDVEVRRKIRQTILSGNIDGAIELINHHLPTFLPVNTPTGGVYNTTSKAPNGSHELSTLTNGSSPTRQASPPRSPTPVSIPIKTDSSFEKTSQKPDAPPTTALETNSPTPEHPKHAHTPTQTHRNPKSINLGRSVNPTHILFNLRVQQFVEAVRTVPLPPSTKGHEEAPLKPQTKIGGVEDAKMETPGLAKDQDHKDSSSAQLSSEARQRRLLQLASGLYQNIKSLSCPSDREVYAKEVEQVCSLMLGPSPESSLAAPYLSMSRREAVADQIWAQTAKVVWDQVAAMHAPMPRIDEIPVDVRMYARYVVRSTEGEDQAQEDLAVPFDFHSLAQA